MQSRRISNLVATLILLTGHLGSARFYSEAEEKILRDSITSKITKNSPPAGMVNDTVFIFIDLYQIVSVDEKNGILALKLWMYIYYELDLLWDEAQFGGLRTMQFPMDTFWKPDIIPLDAVELKYHSYSYQAVLHKGAVAAWSSMFTAKFSCSFDATKFPFDQHNCSLRFGQWLTEKDEYNISAAFSKDGKSVIALSFYKEHDQWELIRPLYTEVRERRFRESQIYQDLVLDVQIARRPRFYCTLIILPILLLYLLSPMVFLLPTESGEKTSMSITILLAQVVSMGNIADVLPDSSMNFPILTYFLAISILQMGLNTILTVLVINIHSLDGDHKVPNRLRKILSSRFLYVLFMTPCPVKKVRPLAKQAKPQEPKKSRGGKDFCNGSDSEAIGKETKVAVMKLRRSKSPRNENGTLELKNLINSTRTVTSKTANADQKAVTTFAEIVSNVTEVESSENMEFLWKTTAVFLDRVLFVVNLIITAVLVISFSLAFY